ncbi:type II toxin-antitoxin system VapC family toxin [Viridibacillus sp. NPDC096237]|uniref:type II toxin-antitoxin system VapC family toxin n=1 Tax=Viridibacillus sp. NPDC096237 TaxID=3390721 RepID=UPI003CFBE8F7
MMVKINKLSTYTIKEEDSFFFDANVWMYIYCSIGNHKPWIVKAYSDFYQKVRESGNTIYTNSLLVSEFVNRYERLEFSHIQKKDGLVNFKKDFRDNQNYEGVFSNIQSITKNKIMLNSQPLNDKFDAFDFENFISIEDKIDFNDAIHCYLALESGLKIVTHDQDYKTLSHEIEIITN